MRTELTILWLWGTVRRIQGAFDTVPSRYAATVASAVVFVLVVLSLFYGGRHLKKRYDNDAVQAVQSLLLTTTAVLLTGFLVAVWRLPEDVLEALAFLSVTPEQGVKALVTFIVVAGGVTITRLTKRSIKYGAGRIAITPHQREVAHHVVQALIFVPLVTFVVALWGIPVRNLFLGAGVLGIVLGFAARKTLSGILSGFVILFARPFEIGDWIRIADREGIVTDITIYNTQIRTFNEEHVLVPNDTITENEIVNYSKTNRLRLETDIGIDYETDVATAASIAVGAMERLDTVASQPPPDVIRREFSDSAVILRLRYWITTPTVQEKWRAQNDVVESVKRAFENEGIKIPFPQRELSDRGGEPEDRSKETVLDRSERPESIDSNDIDESVTEPPADEDSTR